MTQLLNAIEALKQVDSALASNALPLAASPIELCTSLLVKALDLIKPLTKH